MRRVTDTEQAGFMPAREAIDSDGEQLHIIERCEFCDAIGEERRLPDDIGAERIETAAMNLVNRAFGDDIPALPIVAAIDLHENAAGAEAAPALLGIAGLSRHSEPKDVHWRADISHNKPAARANGGMAAIGGDDEIGFDFDVTFRRMGADASHLSAPVNRACHFCAHQQCEIRSEEHTSELQSRQYLVCRLLLENKK